MKNVSTSNASTCKVSIPGDEKQEATFVTFGRRSMISHVLNITQRVPFHTLESERSTRHAVKNATRWNIT